MLPFIFFACLVTLLVLLYIRKAFQETIFISNYYRHRSVCAHRPPKESRATRLLQTILLINKNAKA